MAPRTRRNAGAARDLLPRRIAEIGYPSVHIRHHRVANI